MERTDQIIYEQIAADLMEAVRSGVLHPGERIASVAELRNRYGVSHVTVLRGYRKLSQAGVIEKNGHGYRVCTPNIPGVPDADSARAHTAGLYLRPYRQVSEENYFNEVNCAIDRELLSARLDGLRSFAAGELEHIVQRDPDAMLANLTALAKHCCGILVDERVPDEVLRCFMEEVPLPLVLVGRRSALPMSSVVYDNAGAVAEILKTAAHLGYERLVYCDAPQTRYWNEQQRIDCLKKAQLRGAPIPVEFLPLVRWRRSDCFARLADFLAPGNPRTVFLTSHDQTAWMLCNLLSEHGVTAGRDCGVCGFYGTSYRLADGRRIASLRPEMAKLGKTAVELLLRSARLPGNFPEKVQVPVEFLLGDTM